MQSQRSHPDVRRSATYRVQALGVSRAAARQDVIYLVAATPKDCFLWQASETMREQQRDIAASSILAALSLLLYQMFLGRLASGLS